MRAKTNIIGVTYILAVATAALLITNIISTTTNPLGSILGVILSINQNLVFAQANNASSSNVTGATTGEKEFYVFTAEIPDVDEDKLKVAGDSFSLTTMIVNKGDKVTVHFTM
jgi:c-di-GMP-binding flagellar brake protein YcgR